MPPTGKIYLPDSSYREMTEWALPKPTGLSNTSGYGHEMEHDPRWPLLSQVRAGGFLRNFKVKYPEADEMYTRMLMVSQRLASRRASQPGSRPGGNSARAELIGPSAIAAIGMARSATSTCRIPRNAVYQHLIVAENLLSVPPIGRKHGLRPRLPISSSMRGKRFFWPTTSWPRCSSPYRGGQTLRTRRSLDLPQSAGHAGAAARSLPCQGVGRTK